MKDILEGIEQKAIACFYNLEKTLPIHNTFSQFGFGAYPFGRELPLDFDIRIGTLRKTVAPIPRIQSVEHQPIDAEQCQQCYRPERRS